METLAEAVRALSAMEPSLGVPPTKQVQGEVRIGESAKRTMHSAQEIAGSLSHPHVHWGHILLGLALGGEPGVQDALARASLTSTIIRDRLGDEPAWRVA
jgi:hypothetical protein